jgi:hypothetical protein
MTKNAAQRSIRTFCEVVSLHGTRPHGDEMIQAPQGLVERVIALLEQARAKLVRSVNSGMMITYWSIGREIQALQGGEE